MEDDTSSDELLQVYVESLESQIESKRDFLRQVQDVIGGISGPAEPEGDWKDLLAKPLFRPERSDPIGLCMASVSHTTRLETTKEWITDMESHIPRLEAMLENQKRMNYDLGVLIELLEKKLDSLTSPTVKKSPQSPEARNEQLWNELEHFVKNYLSVDLVDAEDAGKDLFSDVFPLIKRLLDGDGTLKATDFHHCSKGLYRLLLRSNLINVREGPNGVKYVKLLDFASRDLS